MKALEKEPDRRYGTPSELVADIGRHLRHEPVLARAPNQVYRMRKYVRRHRIGVAVASGLALLLVGFAATMTVQTRRIAGARHEAEVQRSRAERRLQDVRKLATSFVFDFHDAIANLAGATAARQLVVSKGLEYLDRLAADSENDRSLQADLADAYDRMSDIQGNPFASNIGDVRASLESTKKATAIREALARNLDPQSPEGFAYRRSLLRLGDAYQATGRSKDAADVYRQVVTAGDVSFTRNPEDPETRKVVARATQRLCAISMALGDTKGALGSCQRSVALYDGLLASASADMGLKEDAAGASAPTQRAPVDRKRPGGAGGERKGHRGAGTSVHGEPDQWSGAARTRVPPSPGRGPSRAGSRKTVPLSSPIDGPWTASTGSWWPIRSISGFRVSLSYLLLRRSSTLLRAERRAKRLPPPDEVSPCSRRRPSEPPPVRPT